MHYVSVNGATEDGWDDLCRILAEGVDFPDVDAIMFVDPKESPIMIAQAMGTEVGQLVSAALAGQMTVDAALKQAQQSVSSTMEQAGYK